MHRSRARLVLLGSIIVTASTVLALFVPAARAVTKATEKVFGEPHEAEALVYFLREPRFQGSARTMFLYADETFLGVLDNAAYTFAYLEPGAHLLWLNWAKVTDEVELEAGAVYYFTVWSRFVKLDEASAQRLIEELKFYTTPEAKEEETAKKHIADRYKKAERRAEMPKKDYIGTDSKREEHVAKWAKVDLAEYSSLYVEDFLMKDPKAAERKKDHLVDTVGRRLAVQIVDVLGEGVFTEVHLAAVDEPARGGLVLRGEITQYKPGSDAARMMIAGAGSAHLDFTAHLINGSSGEEVVSFSGERTWAWGGAAGASRGIQDLEQNVAYEIALYLKRSKGVEK